MFLTRRYFIAHKATERLRSWAISTTLLRQERALREHTMAVACIHFEALHCRSWL